MKGVLAAKDDIIVEFVPFDTFVSLVRTYARSNAHNDHGPESQSCQTRSRELRDGAEKESVGSYPEEIAG